MWNRIKRLAKAQLNDFKEGDITPEQLFQYRVQELEVKLRQAGQTVVTAQSQVAKLEKSLTNTDGDMAQADEKIREAVKRDDDAAAREWIRQMQNLRTRREGIEEHLEKAKTQLQQAQQIFEQAKAMIERQKIEAEIEFGVFRR